MSTLLTVRDVSKSYMTPSRQTVDALSTVSLALSENRAIGIIGESGSGKSTLTRIILGLESPQSGSVHFAGRDLATLSSSRIRAIRADLTAVFQEPFQSLNPRMTIARIVGEPLAIHRSKIGRQERHELVMDALDRVGLPANCRSKRPRELSGGQQQRVGIARALITGPELMVLDEPTSSLDVSVKARILDLLLDLRAELSVGMVVVSHDIDAIRALADGVIVLHKGRVLEDGPATQVLTDPAQAYTRNLIASRLSLSTATRRGGD